MWIKHEKSFRFHNYIRMVIVTMVLVKACDACGGGGGGGSHPSPQRPPSTPKTKTTTSSFGTGTVQTSPSKSSTFSTAISSANTSNTSQVENYTICYTTSVQNLTEMKIASKIEVLMSRGNLSVIFKNVETKKRNVFLKWLQSNTTTCSNVQGYFITIARVSTSYSYNITLLNQTSATEHCKQARNCSDLGERLGGLTTMTSKPTSKPTEQLNSTVPSFHQTEGNNPTNTKEMTDSHTNEPAAGRSEDSEVSTTTVVGISVAVVVLLVIVVVIALWYKRRSARKGYGEDNMRGSVDHLAGPINGDVYTVVNPNAEKTGKGKSESNDMVYIELSHQKSGADKVCKVPSSQQENYADISHILTPGESTYENATPQCDQDYANVVVLQ